MRTYKAEGSKTYRQTEYSVGELKKSMQLGEILEAPVIKCDSDLNLYLNLGNNITGIIKMEDVEIPRAGGRIKNAAVVSRVTRPTCFKVVSIDNNSDGTVTCNLSRRLAQEECIEQFISKLKPGKIINAKVTHVADYGAFCDIGCGIIALLPSDNFCMARFSDPRMILASGDEIKVIVKSINEVGKIILSMKELLGTWEEEASKFKTGDTVAAIVRSVEDYGVFIELTPNLAGLAEVFAGVKPGDTVSVAVKAIIPERMKVKLMIVDNSNSSSRMRMPLQFHIPESGELIHWVYSPENSSKLIESTIRPVTYKKDSDEEVVKDTEENADTEAKISGENLDNQ